MAPGLTVRWQSSAPYPGASWLGGSALAFSALAALVGRLVAAASGSAHGRPGADRSRAKKRSSKSILLQEDLSKAAKSPASSNKNLLKFAVGTSTECRSHGVCWKRNGGSAAPIVAIAVDAAELRRDQNDAREPSAE